MYIFIYICIYFYVLIFIHLYIYLYLYIYLRVCPLPSLHAFCGTSQAITNSSSQKTRFLFYFSHSALFKFTFSTIGIRNFNSQRVLVGRLELHTLHDSAFLFESKKAPHNLRGRWMRRVVTGWARAPRS